MTERIVVAVDGGSASAAALDWVIDRARSRDVEVRVTTIVVAGAGEASRRAQQEDAVAHGRDRIVAEAPGTPVTEVVRRGDPASSLTTDSADADLVVVGAHLTGTIGGARHGALASLVAGRSTCPTVVVPENWAPGRATRGVVVAWEDAESSGAALAFATRAAASAGEPLTILHTWRALPSMAFDALGTTLLLEEHIDMERHELAQLAARVRLANPALVVIEQFEPGPASRALRRAGTGSSLVVTESHARGVLGEFTSGSVSRDVLVALPAPIAVVPSEGSPALLAPVWEEEVA